MELFAFHRKDNSELFFPINKFVFDFCCLCLFCYNAGQHAILRQKHGIQHRVISSVCHLILATLWCGRTDGHVTITSLPKFLGLIGYQEGVMNLGLGTSAGIGEWKSEVSGHRDVTYVCREIQRKVNKWLHCLQSSFSKRTDQNNERTKGMLHAIT